MAKKEKTKESETSKTAKLPIEVKKTKPVRFNSFKCLAGMLGISILPPTKVFDIDGDQDESLLFNAARPGVIIIERTDLSPTTLDDEIKVELVHPSDESKDMKLTLGGDSHRLVVSTSKVPRTYLHSGADINLKISSSNGSVFGVMFIEE